MVHSSSTSSLDGAPGTFGLKFQSEGGFERDATFFHRETSPALISDFMAKLRPRPSARPSIRGIRRPRKGALSRSPSLALPLFLRDSIKISRHWPFTCLARPAARRRRRAHGWQMADSIREVRPRPFVRPSERMPLAPYSSSSLRSSRCCCKPCHL